MASFETPRNLLAELEAKKLEPIYCLHGKEKYLLARALRALRDAILEPATKDFNHDVLDARAAGSAGILTAVRTLPMMASRRLVVVRGIDELRSEALEDLLPYLEKPSAETVVIFLAEKVDARMKFFGALKKKGALCSFDPPRDRELPAFVLAEARARGGKMEPDAARLLSEIIGPDLGMLSQSVEKLILFTGGRPISQEDVATCVADTKVRSIFDLTNAVGQGKREQALRLIQRMIQDRESPLGIVAMLARHFRQLWMLTELVEAKATKNEITSALGINPYFVDGMVTQSRRFTAAVLRRIFEQLYLADKALKSSKLDDAVLLEHLVDQLASNSA